MEADWDGQVLRTDGPASPDLQLLKDDSCFSDSELSEMSHSPISLINPASARFLPPSGAFRISLGDPVSDYHKILDESPTTSITSSAASNFDISDCEGSRASQCDSDCEGSRVSQCDSEGSSSRVSQCDTLDDSSSIEQPEEDCWVYREDVAYVIHDNNFAEGHVVHDNNFTEGHLCDNDVRGREELVRREVDTSDSSLRHQVASLVTSHLVTSHLPPGLRDAGLSSETLCNVTAPVRASYHASGYASGPCLRTTGSEPRAGPRSGPLHRMSYVARALALARPTSPPPAYRTESQPTVLALRSYFNFAQVGARPHSAPNTCYSTRPRYDPGDMTNEPYTLQATHIIQPPAPAAPRVPSPLIVPADPLPESRGASLNNLHSVSPFSRRRGEVASSSRTPPCSYHNRRGAVQEHHGRYGYCCHGYQSESSVVSTPVVPVLVIDTQVVNPEDALPPPYTAGDWIASIHAPRYSEVVNTRYMRSSSFFHQHNAFSCMGSVRTLAIGITLCCCGVVFLMVTYVFGAVANTYLGYLGILQVIIGLTMILLVAIYNSGRCNFLNFVKRYRICPCHSPEPSPC